MYSINQHQTVNEQPNLDYHTALKMDIQGNTFHTGCNQPGSS